MAGLSLVGAGGLNVAVEGPSKAEISVHDNKDGTVAVSYLPAAPGEYKISVKFADKPIKGSPFTAKITGEKPVPSPTGGQERKPFCMIIKVHISKSIFWIIFFYEYDTNLSYSASFCVVHRSIILKSTSS